MNEQSLNKRLRRGVVVCVFIGVLIVGLGFAALRTMNRSLGELAGEQMRDESDEYRRRILRQIDKDFQTLQTLASFFAQEDLESEGFVDMLYEANLQNDFVAMAYFGGDGVGSMAHQILGIERNVDYRTLNTGVVKAIEEAYQGQRGLSPLFESQTPGEKLFVYCVPVYGDEFEILGVLTASSNVEVFEDILERVGSYRKSGAVHLVASNGKILISPEQTTKTQNLESVFIQPFFSQEDLERIQTAVKNEESVMVMLHYDKKSYHTFLCPVGVNNWYVMFANNQKKSNRVIYQIMNTMGLASAIMCSVVVLLLFYIVHQIQRNNRDLVGLAYVDPLTKADNLRRFRQNLRRARQRGRGFCVAGLNIRQFKFINEIFGTNEGNRLLCNIRDCIAAILREDEFFCRESGDQFYLFMWDTKEAIIRSRIDRIMRDIFQCPAVREKDYRIGLYSGAVIWTPGEEELSSEMIITRCRFAMDYSKGIGTAPVHFYDSDLHKSEEVANYVESHMHQALVKGEFRLFLQPKIDLKTGELRGAEALVRWVTEDGNMIFPNVFIPRFEKNGFCVKLDMYMVEQVCRQLRCWMDAGLAPIPISINQTKLLFFESGYLRNLQSILQKYQIPASLITLEILEGLALERAEEINEKLHSLRDMGFCISMDDFGSGYASFNTLGNLEIDELKLDRSFLVEVSKDHGNRFRMIMGNIIQLSKSLHISTVAEGVETKEDESLIRSLGCDIGQGYLYSRPIPAEEFGRKYMEKDHEK